MISKSMCPRDLTITNGFEDLPLVMFKNLDAVIVNVNISAYQIPLAIRFTDGQLGLSEDNRCRGIRRQTAE